MTRAPKKQKRKMKQEDSRREKNSLDHLKYEIAQEHGLKSDQSQTTKS